MVILQRRKTYLAFASLVFAYLFWVIPEICHAQSIDIPSDQDITNAQTMSSNAINATGNKLENTTIGDTLPQHGQNTAVSNTKTAIDSVKNGDMQNILSSFPKVDAMPTPNIQQNSGNLEEIAKQFNKIKNIKSSSNVENHLLILVSFSIPKESLNRIIDDAQIYHAALVFRGIVNNNMNDMRQAIFKILKGRKVTIYIDPPLFEHFAVMYVPTIVIGNRSDNKLLESGCAKPDNYVKITGDVSLRYALEKISSESKAWAPVADTYLRYAKNGDKNVYQE